MSEASAERLLRVIKALNQGGPRTVVSLQQETRISRPAIYRLLHVLSQHGYAERSPDQAEYQLTPSIQELCDQVRDNDRVAAAATPILKRLHKAIVWPTSLAVFEGGVMVIRATTRSSSPLVFDRARVGEHIPILNTAVGSAFLAFSPTATRRAVLNMLSKSESRGSARRDLRRMNRILDEAVKRGYAVRTGGTVPHTTSVAVPVLDGRYAVGSIVVSFLSTALSADEGAASFVGPLRTAAREIADSLRMNRMQLRNRRTKSRG